MRLCRFRNGAGADRLGVVRDGRGFDVTPALEALPAYRFAFPPGDPVIANLGTLRPALEAMAGTVTGVPAAEIAFLSPVANPSKIIGVPQNYEEHAEEATADEIADAGRLDFCLSVVSEMRQKNNTANLVLDLPGQIAWASKFYTLHPGDIIMSGICAGVAQIAPGDVMHVEFEGVGAMDAPVRAHSVY